jgi:DNA-directed RNA polymerase specialized sigma24 family protein
LAVSGGRRPGASLRSGRSGLSREAFESLLAQLGPDRERAGERYESIRRRLVRLFEWRGCEFPEELADETFNRVARRLAEGLTIQSQDPYSFFCGVAHLLHKEVLRERARERQALESGDWTPYSAPEEEEPEDRRLGCIRLCLGQLPADQRQLILDYHQGEDRIRSRQRLSLTLGLPLNALRIRVHRVRRQLGDCLDRCLERAEGR